MSTKHSETKIVFLDCETTGFSKSRHEIIEIGAVIYDQRKDEVVSEWGKKIKPTNIKSASKEALDINGYSKNKKLYKAGLQGSLVEFNALFTEPHIVIGQNIQFDLGFLSVAFNRYGIKNNIYRFRSFDLLSMAWPLIKDSNIDRMTLSDLCNQFEVPILDAHTAIGDCRMGLGVYRRIIERYKHE